MFDRLASNPRIKNMNLDEETKLALSVNINMDIDKALKKYLKEYINELYQYMMSPAGQQVLKQNLEQAKNLWVHADRILDCLKMEIVFKF